MKKITTILVILALVIGILTANGPVIASPGNLTNGGFETGNLLPNWKTGTVVDFAGVVGADGYAAPYQGNKMARLGTPNNLPQPVGSNNIYQDFTVIEPTISFAYNIVTFEGVNDNFKYRVSDPNNNSEKLLYIEAASSKVGPGNPPRTTGWKSVTLDLSVYMGQQLRLEFDCSSTGDTGFPTWCYIDDAPTPDAIPPITTASTIPVQNANGWNNTNVTVNLISSDNLGGSGVKEIHYSVDGGAEIIVPGASASFGLSAEGNYNISFYAKDQINNVEASNSRVIKIDKTLPGPTGFTITPPAFSNSTSASFSWASSDNLTPVGGLVYQSSLDGAAFGDIFSGASTGLNGLANGSHTFKVRANDLAGNMESSASYTWVVDNIPPAITTSATANGNPYTSGTWTNKDVVVSFTCSDNTGGSGIAINTVAGGTVNTEGAGQSVPNTGACTDMAGNTATPATFSSINIDKTAPNASGTSVSPPPNNLGWNNSDVTINFTCTDGLSGIASCPPQVISTEGIHTLLPEVTVVDMAGNSVTTTFAQTVIKIDKQKPPVPITLTPPANAYGWNNSTPVTVSLSLADNLSGVVTKEYSLNNGVSWISYTVPLSFTSEGTSSLRYRFTDRAGNVNDKTISILIDLTPPTITASANKADNSAYTAGSWTNQDVTVHYTCADTSGSGISSCTPDQTFSATTATASGTATDKAGNSTSASFGPINIDKTPPTITASANKADNSAYTAGAWTNQNVTAHYACADTGGSSLASCTADQTFSAATASTSGTATDKAGNSTSASFGPVNIDKTPPTITASATKADNSAYTAGSWTNQDVTVHYTCADTSGSGISSCTPDQTFSTPVATTSGAATDNVGNSANATFGPINIDKTAPVTTATPNPAPNTSVSVALACTDIHSGCATTEFKLDGAASWTAYAGPISVTGIGTHTLLYHSIDKAGNQETDKTLNINVVINKAPPEAFNQFDPASKDVLVFARFAGSISPSGPITPSSVVPIKWGDGENDKDIDDKDKNDRDRDDENRKGENAELRTYRITDAAGNTLVLVEKVKKTGHEIKVKVVSLQYNNGTVIVPPKNRKSFEWSTEKDGSLKELEQEMEVGKGKDRQDVEAKYDAKKNQTTIKIDEPKPETKIVKTGLALLRMATDKGKLVIEY